MYVLPLPRPHLSFLLPLPCRDRGSSASLLLLDQHASELHQATLVDLLPGWDQRSLLFPPDSPRDANLRHGDFHVEWDGINCMPGMMSSSSFESTCVFPLTPAQQGDLNPMSPQTQKLDTSGELNRVTNTALRSQALVQRDPDTVNQTFRKLSYISIELHDFFLTIPPVAASWEPSAEYSSPEGKEFALDQILELSRLFIDTVDTLFLPSTPAGTSNEQSKDSTPKSTTSDDAAAAAAAAPANTSLLDQPCELLALSSYIRMVEIYHAILEHVVACAKHQSTVSSSSQRNGFLRLPSLAVGSFTMESSSTMQVLVLVHMVELMMTRSRHLIRSVTRARVRDSPDEQLGGNGRGDDTLATWGTRPARSPTVGEATLQGFQPREEALLQLLDVVKRTLLLRGHAQ